MAVEPGNRCAVTPQTGAVGSSFSPLAWALPSTERGDTHMPRDTSDGDDPTFGERVDDWAGVARGDRSAQWRNGRFRNPGARGCGSSALLMLVAVVSAAAVRIRWRR